jgi:hypothetical protein
MTDDFKERLRNTDHNWHAAACAEAEHRIEAQAAEIEMLRGHLEIWIFHNQRAMGQKSEDARAYAKAWLFRNANGEEPE